MKTILALASLICALWSQGGTSFAASDGERNEEFFLEAALEGCCDEGDKRWKGHVQRVLETVGGMIVRERFVARAAFSTKSLQFESNRATAKKGIVLKLSNADGPYAECHLPLKNFDIELNDWKFVTKAAFSVSFEARIKKGQWIVKKSKKGEYCDLNLGQPDIQRGIPEVQVGDLVEVFTDGVKVLEGDVRLEDD